jgi:hypothetical protein
MYLTIQDFNNYKDQHGIPPLPPDTQELLCSLEKSLNVESIELAITQYQQLKASQYANTGHHHTKQRYIEPTTDAPGKWCKNEFVSTASISTNGNKSHNSFSRNTNQAVFAPTTTTTTSSSSSSSSQPNTKEKWVKYVDTIGEFKATKITTKEGIEKTINDIRINLNKITKKNYETQKDKIFELIESIIVDPAAAATTTDPTESVVDPRIHQQRVAHFIFDISSSNKFFSELYANLYKELIEHYHEVFIDTLNEFIANFKESIQTFVYCDPDADYDKYCAFVKESDRKKAITTFIIMLLNRGVVLPSVVIEITDFFQRMIQIYIDEENRANEINELGEILYILVSLGNEKLQWEDSTEWNFIIHNICEFTTLKVKEHKSISSRFIFKMKDLYDLL